MNERMSVEEITKLIFEEIFDKEMIYRLKEIELSKIVKKLDYPGNRHQLTSLPSFVDEIAISKADGMNKIDTEIVLATYTMMGDNPGKITFFKAAIKLYVCTLISQIVSSGVHFGLNSALYTIYFVVQDLKQHESFHFYCDVKRHLNHSQFDIDLEDALAVAHSYNCFSSACMVRDLNLFYGHLYNSYVDSSFLPKLELSIRLKNRQLFELLKVEHFKAYSLFNGRNWQSFTGRECYKTAFYDYLKSDNTEFLRKFGVRVDDIFDEVLFVGNHGADIVVDDKEVNQ